VHYRHPELLVATIALLHLQGSSGALLQRTALILQSTNPAASHSAIHSQTQSC
jgi:hypothetical protein